MARWKVSMRSAGARAVMNSPGVQGDLLARAQRVAGSASAMGPGEFAADVRAGANRAHAMAKTTDARSMASNAKHNSLLKSIGAGR